MPGKLYAICEKTAGAWWGMFRRLVALERSFDDESINVHAQFAPSKSMLKRTTAQTWDESNTPRYLTLSPFRLELRRSVGRSSNQSRSLLQDALL
jgi:hypothetical protein